MTPKRRQGSGRAAFDHISAGLTDALSSLSTVNASQTIVADIARGDLDRAAATVSRLEDDLLVAITRVAVQFYEAARDEQINRINEKWRETHPPCGCIPTCRCRLNAEPPCRCKPNMEGTSP